MHTLNVHGGASLLANLQNGSALGDVGRWMDNTGVAQVAAPHVGVFEHPGAFARQLREILIDARAGALSRK
jgi:hypothetical protein